MSYRNMEFFGPHFSSLSLEEIVGTKYLRLGTDGESRKVKARQ